MFFLHIPCSWSLSLQSCWGGALRWRNFINWGFFYGSLSRAREAEGVQRPGNHCGTVEELSALGEESQEQEGTVGNGVWAIYEFSKDTLLVGKGEVGQNALAPD